MSNLFRLASALAAGSLVLAACGAQATPTAVPPKPTEAPKPAATAAPAQPTAVPAQPTAAPAAPTAAPKPTEAPKPAAGKLEIFSWWTNGGEATGLEKMYGIYKQQNAGVDIVNATVAGGAGTNAKTVLKTRLQGGQPPDSWQVHAGKELVSYVDAGQMQPLTAFFREQGWDKVMPKLLLDQITYKGEIWSVPVNVHRSNVLWYNKALFDANGLKAPVTYADFVTVAEALKAKGITPLAVGGADKFETPHLFESVLLGTFGPEEYTKLFKGQIKWDDPRVKQAADTAAKMLSYANKDRSSIGWADAMQLVLDGKAGMTIMGDWAHGYALSKGKKPGVDYGYSAAPGNNGVFMWLSDSFGLAKGAPNEANARKWLATIGSKAGQDAFNPAKGSIPARTDGDRALYDVYLQSAMDAFGKETLAPSVVHGAAAPEAYMTSYGNALNVFGADLDAQTLLTALKDAAKDIPVEAAAPAAAAVNTNPGKLEIFSWWTNGGEATGLEKMYGIYKQQNTRVDIVNATVAGGAGTNAKTVLKTRLQGGQPPDSWQVHAGKELVSYVDAGQMQPLTAFFKEQGWDKVMPKLLLDQITYKGEIWSVPVNIHRSNVLWYNIKLFQDNNLTPPTTFDDFVKVAEALKAKGITPLAVGGADKFETPHLFESVLVGAFGPADYAKLFQPGANWGDARVKQAADTAAKMLSYANKDRSSIGWADAMQLVLDGKAGMTIMGDWAHGYALSKGKKPGVDYGYAAAPGNNGVFMWLSDSFGLAKGAPNEAQAKSWLAVCGSKAGQDAFNPAKGSIPARTDADKSLYDVYLQSAMDAFGKETLAPSVVHGAAAPEAYMTSYGNALNVFGADLDVQTLLTALKDAAKDIK